MPRGIGYGKKARGRGRGQGGGQMERLPGGNLPKQGRMPKPKRGPMGVPPKEMPGGRRPGGRPNGGTMAPPRPARGRGRQGKGQGATKGKGVGVSGAALPGPGGRQLAARVAAGKITQEQADRTMKQRQTLQKAFGKDWRTKVFGDRGYVKRTRVARSKNPKNPKLAALNKKLMERRKQMLDVARKKNKGGEEDER